MAEVPAKPEWVLDREREWSLLGRFATESAPQLRLGIVSGRRRNGKSYLLRALTQATGGLYLAAVLEEGRVPAMRRFARAIAVHAGVAPESLRLDDWEEVLRTALDVVNRASGAPILVIDELPYVLQHSPEVAGLLQLLYDQSQFGEAAGGRVILCGSAMSVMSELLSGTRPLRGRANVDLRLGGFDFRTSRTFWEIEDPVTALLVDAVLGGAPGYRTLAEGRPTPRREAEFADWVCSTLLDPGMAMYSRTEAEHLLLEEPRITHRTLYYDLLTAVANGASTPSKIGRCLEKQRSAVVAPLELLESTGYLHKAQDLLKPRNPVITVTDPIIRFNQLVTLPYVDLIEVGRAAEAWRYAQPTFQAKILGPHFEELARDWARRFAAEEAALPIGTVGSATISDPAGRTRHEIDVLALAPGVRPNSANAAITLIGEAKATVAQRDLRDLERLEHIRELLAEQGHQTSDAVLALFSLNGFRPDLRKAAARRRDVLLMDAATMYGDTPVGVSN